MFWKKKKKEGESLFTLPGQLCDKVVHLSQDGKLMGTQKLGIHIMRIDNYYGPFAFFGLLVDTARNKNIVVGPDGTVEEAVSNALSFKLPYAILYLPTDELEQAIKIVNAWSAKT